MATQQWKHQVFISFRGEDTRRNFVCHLDKALSGKGLKTFVDDQLRRGEEINTALLQAIQDSKVALIIFSENYASSRWCLDELLKIIECHETHDQIVIPVFYLVNPSDVRNQNGSFGKSFAEHGQNPRYSNKIQKWKDALTKAANKSGWDSDIIREDNKLINQIVRDVLEKLKLLYPCQLLVLDLPNSNIKQILNEVKVRTYYLDMLNSFLFEIKTVIWIYNYLLLLVQDGGKLKMVAQSLIESPLIARVTDIVFGKLPFGIAALAIRFPHLLAYS
ncbi:hypothetical protein K2173_009293 [Erythroxylum novogranatense]|uniref:TIR domain-containing protein n=1 Tax=Erythroxylum novogranatense TaxID=1862640 RepID=A0AAV8SZR6_9ROSI|nr:hypothetical protein K2173_009293 [Erythroxylum novogranatense]